MQTQPVTSIDMHRTEEPIKKLNGKELVHYSDILDLAHQKDLISIDVELLQYPSEENGNSALCRAVCQTSIGGTFTDIGSANPSNCNSRDHSCLIKTASTRAKSRCLKDLTNVGTTVIEEIETSPRKRFPRMAKLGKFCLKQLNKLERSTAYVEPRYRKKN